MIYAKPRVYDLGAITEHTYYAGNSGKLKGGQPPDAHIDKHCEWSGGSDIDYDQCVGEIPIRDQPPGHSR